ncbi:MAG: hypothetical protein ACP5XB_03030 [Isosphaeraceae bacterium]
MARADAFLTVPDEPALARADAFPTVEWAVHGQQALSCGSPDDQADSPGRALAPMRDDSLPVCPASAWLLGAGLAPASLARRQERDAADAHGTDAHEMAAHGPSAQGAVGPGRLDARGAGVVPRPVPASLAVV